MVQFLKFFLADPCGPSHPRLLPFLITLDPEGKTVILHAVDLFVRKSAQSGPEVAEYALIGKVLLCHCQKAPHILYK